MGFDAHFASKYFLCVFRVSHLFLSLSLILLHCQHPTSSSVRTCSSYSSSIIISQTHFIPTADGWPEAHGGWEAGGEDPCEEPHCDQAAGEGVWEMAGHWWLLKTWCVCLCFESAVPPSSSSSFTLTLSSSSSRYQNSISSFLYTHIYTVHTLGCKHCLVLLLSHAIFFTQPFVSHQLFCFSYECGVLFQL